MFGEDNKFGHPDEITLKTLKSFNVKVLRTDKMGEINIAIDRNGNIKMNSYCVSSLDKSIK